MNVFRIESYITPIILSYIDKYVKDFRSRDAQVSLWGGAAAFQNLDLRLDVLEEELQLPFSFVSGHIHELTIKVPWTKIASEPIEIIINTIEFVLKLKSPDDVQPTKALRRRPTKTDIVQEPPGYMASLVNKIANNISLKLHNIILKYVEEDIVVSMNIQLLTFDSADDNWNAAFIDISPTKVLLKKVINISDLTICLDKRNSMGKIDICQEPMLYRCTLQVRLIRKYNISSVHRSSLIRIDIFTESVELNISAQQYPMLMRLLELAMALNDGRIRDNLNSNINLSDTASVGNTTASGGGTVGGSGTGEDELYDESEDDSWLTWAWNSLPSIFPVEYLDDEMEEKGHYSHMGFYVNNLKITFKSQEITGDGLVHSTKKIKYHPIIRVSLVGIYVSAISLGSRWYNLKGGVSYIGVYPIGVCLCGKRHSQTSILTSADLLYDHMEFLKDSLKDPNRTVSSIDLKYYDTLREQTNLENIPEDDLLERTPAIAFHIIHEVKIPDDSARSSSVLESDLEYSNLSESYVCRGIINEFTFKYSESFDHILQILKEYASRYDYAPYTEEKPLLTLNQLTPPSTDDFDALMVDIPLKVFELSIKKPIVHVYIDDHDKQNPPYIHIEIKQMNLQLVNPLYPNRLVHTTCQLPKPPTKLLDHCYQKIFGDCKGISMGLCTGNKFETHFQLPTIEVSSKMLLKKEFWKITSPSETISTFKLDSILIKMNKPTIICLQHLLNCFVQRTKPNEIMFQSTILMDVYDYDLPVLDVKLGPITMTASTIDSTVGVVGTIGSIFGFIYQPKTLINNQPEQKSIFITNIKNENSISDMLTLTLQLPVNYDKITTITKPPILILNFNELNLIIDPLISKFLNYQIKCSRIQSSTTILQLSQSILADLNNANTVVTATNTSSTTAATSLYQKSPRKSVTTMKSSKKSTINPPESVHSSSEQTMTITNFNRPIKQLYGNGKPNNSTIKLNDLHKILKAMVIQLDIKQWTIYSCDKILHFKSNLNVDVDTVGLFDKLTKETPSLNYAVFKLPAVSVKSSHESTHSIDVERRFPIMFPNAIWTEQKDGFPWNISISNLCCFTHLNGEQFKFCSSIKTKITVVVTVKSRRSATDEKTSDANLIYDPSFVIHVDTAPIELNLCEKQLLFLHSSIRSIISLLTISYCLPNYNKPELLEISERPTSPNYQQQDLKEFFGTNITMSENSSEDTIQESANMLSAQGKPSTWIQWTLEKFTIKFIGRNAIEECEFIVDIEDIITSVDQQDIYTKVKIKFGSPNGICKTRQLSTNNSTDWIKNDLLALISKSDILSDALADTFFDLTITKAITTNVHNKWGAAKRKKNMNLIETMTEINVNIQSIDLILGLEMMETFLPILNAISIITDDDSNGKIGTHCDGVNEVEKNKVLSVSDLPLVFFKSKGIGIFVPMLSQSKHCNVLFFKINKISIMPSVENPLCRKPVRGDIYNKAAQLRILNVPGSKIEDRQYEILFNNISLGSGKWEEILSYLDPATDLEAYNENPAFDWNNSTARPSIETNTVFNRFNLSFVYAPCIIFENILVCGKCMEINSLTDLMIELNTHEVRLLNALLIEFLRVTKFQQTTTINTVQATTFSRKSNEKISNISSPKEGELNQMNKSNSSEKQMTIVDSGFESLDYSQRKNQKCIKNTSDKLEKLRKSDIKTIPYDISFVGGIFDFKLYHSISRTSPTTTEKEKENNSSTTRRCGLFSLTLLQPNFLISQSVIEKTTQLSLFNLTLKLGNSFEINSSSSSSTTSSTEFNDILFDTEPGEPNQAGIPPPLLHYKENILHSGEKHLHIEITRPMIIRFSSKTLEKLLAIKRVMTELALLPLLSNPNDLPLSTKQSTDKIIQPISKQNKINTIKEYLFDADHLFVSIDQTHIDFSNPQKYNLKCSFAKIINKIEIFDHPKRLSFNLTIESLMINTGRHMLLNPLTLNFMGNLIKENWKKAALASCNIQSTYIDVCLGPNNILELLKAQKEFLICFELYQNDENLINSAVNNSTIDTTIDNNKKLTQISTPKCHRPRPVPNDEYYKDDLRAGAFQFIESDQQTLPLPYQIQIITRDGGIICWRYPQPRALNCVQIFPVPFAPVVINSNSPNHTTIFKENQTIKCQLEYYSPATASFLPYCEFFISEKSIQQLELPSKKFTAEIWRIVVFQHYVSFDGKYFQGSDDSDDDDDDDEDYDKSDCDDEDVQRKTLLLRKSTTNVKFNEYFEEYFPPTSNLNLHPRALVGCMRIDSYFSPKLVPNFELAINIDYLTISLKNQISKTVKMPMPIKQHRHHTSGEMDLQTFLKLNLRSIKTNICFYEDTVLCVQAEMNLNCQILELTYLTMQSLIEDFHFKLLFDHSPSKSLNGCRDDDDDNDDSTTINLISDELTLRYGQSVGHTLLISQKIWHEMLTKKYDEFLEFTILPTKFTICNRTTETIKFTQINAKEEIFLQPNECYFYTFRSQLFDPKLIFSVVRSTATALATPSDLNAAISIDDQEYKCVKISENDEFLFIKTEKISNNQRIITVRGQIEFLNSCSQSFVVNYRSIKKCDQKQLPPSDEQQPEKTDEIKKFELLDETSVTIFGRCDDTIEKTMKLRLRGNGQKGWSGAIPLDQPRINTPWLVKVPTTDEHQFCSYWVRVIHENVNGQLLVSTSSQPQRLLIIIQPLFMIRSMLSYNVEAKETTSATNTSVTLLKNGAKPLDFNLPATHETSHDIIINNQIKTALSYQSINRSQFFKTSQTNNKTMNINEMFTTLTRPYEISWPCSNREEELRWERKSSVIENFSPEFRVLPSGELSSSLMLDVIPVCYFINSIGITIQVINTMDNNSCLIHSNEIAMPFHISTAFIISIFLDKKWYNSCPIFVSKQNDRKRTPKFTYDLPETGQCIVKILSSNGLSKFQLSSQIENDIRVYYLSPHFVLCNHTDHLLQAWAFCMIQKQKHNINMPDNNNITGNHFVPIKSNKEQSMKGIGICRFFNLSSNPKQEYDFNKLFNYFITIRIGKFEYSMPIPLNKQIFRKCFSVQMAKDKYIPLTVNVLDYQGQTFISIYPDKSPIIQFENRTDLKLYLAQAQSLDPKDGSVGYTQLNDDNFEWYTTVPARITTFFNPPSIDEAFPDKMDNEVGILIANASDNVVNKDEKDHRSSNNRKSSEICWSQTIKIFESTELFLNLPLHGDIKVIVKSEQRTIQVIVDNIDYNMEFNVKDIRTKILNPSSSSKNLATVGGEQQNQSSLPLLHQHQQNNDDKSHETESLPPPTQQHRSPKSIIKINAYIKGIHINVYSDNETHHCNKIDQMAIYLDDIFIFYDTVQRSLNVDLFNIQIDNQLHHTGNFDFPVVLCANKECRRQTPATSSSLPQQLPSLLKISAFHDQLRAEFLSSPPLCVVKIIFYQHDELSSPANIGSCILNNPEKIFCQIQPLRAYIEDKYITVILDFFMENLPTNLIYVPEELMNRKREFCNPGEVLMPKQILLESLEYAEPFKLRNIHIEPLSVLLSVHTCMRVYIALDHSPLNFAPFERRNIYSLPSRFGYNLGMHYVSGAIFGAGWVVGSLEILGSPSGLARSLSLGVRDFFSMPVQGFFRGPWGFLVGITQGSASLVRNITAGTVNSVTKLAASVARNVDRLTLDDEHLQRTEALRRIRPSGISDGFTQGLTGLGISLLGAVGGLARHPLEAQSSVGVVTGFGRGLVGAVTKPISGAAEFVALAGQGMLQAVGFNTMPMPRQPPPQSSSSSSITSLEPSPSKIVCKFLPSIFIQDQVLFSALATEEKKMAHCCVALTNHFIVIISIDTDQLIEILTLEHFRPSINEYDETLITISMESRATQETGAGLPEDIQDFSYDRVLQYVKESSDQISTSVPASKIMVDSQSVRGGEESSSVENSTTINVEGEKNRRKESTFKKNHPKISFFMDRHLGKHFVNYILLLKANLPKN